MSIPRISTGGPRAPIVSAQADVNGGIKSALGQYDVDIGKYPGSLQDLVLQPGSVTNWHGPYLGKLPVDPWGSPYYYLYPGKRNPNGYDLWSAGPDGKEGTADDVGNWQ